MKKLLYIALLILCITSVGYGQSTKETIFSMQGDEIVTKTKFAKPLYYTLENPVPYLFKTFTVDSPDKKHHYTINLYQYKGCEEDGGCFRFIEIKSGDKILLQMPQDDAFDSLYYKIRPMAPNAFFHVLSVNESTTALVFTGWHYGSDPTQLTIIALSKGSVRMVFNGNYLISSVFFENNSLSFILHDDLSFSGSLVNRYKIWVENKELYFGGPYGTSNKNYED